MTGRILVACVGNLLRHDDGFGVAVARVLERGPLPPDVDLIETGIGGMTVVQQLMDGYAALVVVDAVDDGRVPGTVSVGEPVVPPPSSIEREEWERLFQNLHLTEPYRIMLLAKSLGALPPTLRIVGCQPLDVDAMDEHLSPVVAAAVPVAAERVRALLRELSAAMHEPEASRVS